MKSDTKTFLGRFFNRKRELKVVIGAGGIPPLPGWMATDIDTLNVIKKEDWRRLVGDRQLCNVFAEHVWEHLTPEHAEAGNKNIFEYLNPGGRFRLAVPDGFHPRKEYIDYVKPGGTGPGADDHKLLYNYHTLKSSLETQGFRVELLEYWDEQGQFHFENWEEEHGKVIRSKRFDSRNKDGRLNYTSLIVDALKP